MRCEHPSFYTSENGRICSVCKASVRTGPSIDRANSKQDYATPREFLDAVEREFGPIVWDLAASRANRVCENYYGPGSQWAQDAFAYGWASTYARMRSSMVMGVGDELIWLNPPYANIAPWARKCAEARDAGARIAFLVPASVGANWFWDYVAPYARVFSVGRIMFVTREFVTNGVACDVVERPACFDAKGRPTAFPKDLILAIYDRALAPAFERWRWRTPKARAA